MNFSSGRVASNTYFQLKQFRVDQADVAMKVTTEACILGAWTSVNAPAAVSKILDIGTGTGLLALMLAQACEEATITAAEIDPVAARRAQENFEMSPWRERLLLEQCPVQELSSEPYDLIVCNPPFFNRSLQSPVAKVNLARHDSSLTQQDLITSVCRLLHDHGAVFVLYPEKEAIRFQQLAEQYGLSVSQQLIIRDRHEGPVLRVIGQYAFVQQKPITRELIIRQADRSYTPEFETLLKPYYLNL